MDSVAAGARLWQALASTSSDSQVTHSGGSHPHKLHFNINYKHVSYEAVTPEPTYIHTYIQETLLWTLNISKGVVATGLQLLLALLMAATSRSSQ